jgi:hypothetical protein
MRTLPVLMLLACGGSDDNTTDSAGGVPALTFTEIRDDVLLGTCAISGCHGTGSGGLTLDPAAPEAVYDALVNATGDAGFTLVVPGDPDGSYLVQKLEGAAGISGGPMPVPTPLSETDPDVVAGIRAWIASGAPND